MTMPELCGALAAAGFVGLLVGEALVDLLVWATRPRKG